MPIRYVQGDLFLSPYAQAWVNPTNSRGPMGKGLALEFAQRYPGLEDSYKTFCNDTHRNQGFWPVGSCMVWQSPAPQRHVILNVTTKDHYRYRASVEYIEPALRKMEVIAQRMHLTCIAVPALGTGQGKLPWYAIKRLFERTLALSDIDYEVYEPPF